MSFGLDINLLHIDRSRQKLNLLATTVSTLTITLKRQHYPPNQNKRPGSMGYVKRTFTETHGRGLYLKRPKRGLEVVHKSDEPRSWDPSTNSKKAARFQSSLIKRAWVFQGSLKGPNGPQEVPMLLANET